jgi:hypothetical protein
MLTFIDSLNSEYVFTFNTAQSKNIFALKDTESCTIVVHLDGWKKQGLHPAICTFSFTDQITIDDQFTEWWAKTYLSFEARDYVNKLISMKAFI